MARSLGNFHVASKAHTCLFTWMLRASLRVKPKKKKKKRMPMITNYIKLAKQRLKKSLGFVIRLGKKLFSWLLELTIWASCLAWISSDCFESFSSLSNVWIDQPLTLYRDVTTTRKPGSDFDWSHSFAWYSADRIGGMLVEFKHFDNLYRKQ